jgi:hypothetical protein
MQMNTRPTIAGIPQEMTVQTDQITAHGSVEGPRLYIPVKIDFTPNRTGNANPKEFFTVLSVSAELSVTEKYFVASQATMQVSWPIFMHNPIPVTFQFPLTAETLFQIEKYRQGDLAAQLKITIQVAITEDVLTGKPNNETRPVIHGFETPQAHQYFQIAHSLWVNKILLGLGYNAGALVEIPAVSILLPKEYAIAKDELREATRHFIAGQYDTAVAHCRSAIDPINAQFTNIRKNLTSKSEFQWLKKHFSTTYDYIEAILGSNYTLANKGHHPPSFGNFGRAEAETIIGTTTLLIAYFGKIIPDTIPAEEPIAQGGTV